MQIMVLDKYLFFKQKNTYLFKNHKTPNITLK